jgi:hypothetical protein
MQTALIALCLRPGGATTADLYAGTGTLSSKGVPWRDLVVICARRFGYRWEVATDSARRVHYCFTPLADEVLPPAVTQWRPTAPLGAAPAPAAEKFVFVPASPYDMRIR